MQWLTAASPKELDNSISMSVYVFFFWLSGKQTEKSQLDKVKL